MQLHSIDFPGFSGCPAGQLAAGGDVINFHLFCRRRLEAGKRKSAGTAGKLWIVVNTLLIAKTFGTLPRPDNQDAQSAKMRYTNQNDVCHQIGIHSRQLNFNIAKMNF